MKNISIQLVRQPRYLPLHEQVRRGVQYAIAVGQVLPGDQLPSVRNLASRLEVAPNTVGRAYKELQRDGFIVTVSGQGTFVSDFAGRGMSRESSHSALHKILRPALKSAQALGFSDTAIQEGVKHLLERPKVVAGFVGLNRQSVEKWSAILREEFADLDLEIVGLTFDDLRQDLKRALQKLEPALCVLTVLLPWAKVRSILRPHGIRMLALLTELSEDTYQALTDLPTTGPLGLVCLEEEAGGLLGQLSAYVDADRVRWVTPSDEDGMWILFDETETILHSFWAAEFAVAHAKPGTRLVPIRFVPRPNTFEQIRDWFERAGCKEVKAQTVEYTSD